MPNQHSEEALSPARRRLMQSLPGRWSRTKLSRRLHFVPPDCKTTLCGIALPSPTGKGWSEVNLKDACTRCIKMLSSLCPEPGEPVQTPAGVSSTSSLGS